MERRTSIRKAKYRQQLVLGQVVTLSVAALTMVNLLLLLFRVEYHLWLSAAVPYYVNWLCAKLDASAIYTVLAALLGLGLTGVYGVCWYRSGRRRIFMTAALGLYGLDTLLLVIFALTMVNNPASCILEILVHIGVLYLLLRADQAAGAMQRMRQRTCG